MEGFRPYSWRNAAGNVLAGTINEAGNPEWEWSRVHSTIGFAAKDHVLLSRNMDNFHDAMRDVAATQLAIQCIVQWSCVNMNLLGDCFLRFQQMSCTTEARMLCSRDISKATRWKRGPYWSC